uniref:NADH dehydrogenase subunit 5 n=1 Tax=Plator insolens TaxID=2880587 RepID=UPI001F12E543|nr:NADH dehydrogenase subunit 5 [Plator insolens]UMI39150.1 NADH dehydrogenase subunit 5 [Plator insolens]
MIISSISFLLLSLFLMISNIFISFNLSLLNLLSLDISINILIDWISSMFLSTVLFISSMIILFSIYYMPYKQQKQFLILMMMFILSMGILIISNNIFMLLLGWDGLGLSSYILVIYYQNYPTAASGSITLLSNRIGDISILLAIGMLMTLKNWNLSLNNEFPLTIMILLLTAACSKSAQFPFSAWLPAAMAAPTPISALVHSSTLVTAGVFLLIRVMNNPHPISMIILMMISSITMIYSSMSANWEQDLKKIIALSTLSQIAMMMFAISINSIIMAFSHLIIHAMFKSTMFLCAGIMIHESSYQNLHMMGMNNSSTPMMLSTFGITNMSLMGIPFMSSFFSKDIIIEKMISSKLECILSLLVLSSIGMTVSYSIRMSLLSNKFLFKCHPLVTNHHSNFYNIPLTTLSLMIILSGTSIMWSLYPEQILLFPPMFKYTMTIIIIISFMISTLLSFQSKNFLYSGHSAISLWFNHIMSTHPILPLFKMMKIYLNNDKLWQESYGPQKSLTMNSYLSLIPNIPKNSILTSLLLMSIPLILMFH